MVEVLVTIGIVLVLGAMLMPASARVLAMRENVTCSSNLRQIGLGIQAYTLENNGVLPGPLYVEHFPYWNDQVQLAWQLADYLNLDKSRLKLGGPDVFVCPAYRRAMKAKGLRVGDAAVYRLNIKVSMNGEPALPPFGYPNSRYPDVFGTRTDYPPMHQARLGDITDEKGAPAQSSTWMLKDTDKLAAGTVIDPLGYSPLADSMVHGSHRNALFFDFHVGRTDFSKTK